MDTGKERKRNEYVWPACPAREGENDRNINACRHRGKRFSHVTPKKDSLSEAIPPSSGSIRQWPRIKNRGSRPGKFRLSYAVELPRHAIEPAGEMQRRLGDWPCDTRGGQVNQRKPSSKPILWPPEFLKRDVTPIGPVLFEHTTKGLC